MKISEALLQAAKVAESWHNSAMVKQTIDATITNSLYVVCGRTKLNADIWNYVYKLMPQLAFSKIETKIIGLYFAALIAESEGL